MSAGASAPEATDSLASLRPVVPARRLNPLIAVVVGLVSVILVLGALMVARSFGSSAAQLPAPTAIAAPTATAAPTSVPAPTTLPTSTIPKAAALIAQADAKTEQKDYRGAIADFTQGGRMLA
jgi:hypothetical protein